MCFSSATLQLHFDRHLVAVERPEHLQSTKLSDFFFHKLCEVKKEIKRSIKRMKEKYLSHSLQELQCIFT